MRRFALAAVVIAGLSADALANGRAPGTSTIHFRDGNDQDVFAGMTFGAVVSHDGGATWQWFCEAAVGYGGMYDPAYVYTQTGAVFATTFKGLKVLRPAPAGDGCTFAATPPGTVFVTALALGPDHALYYGASTDTDSKIYKSVDDGMSFPTSAEAGIDGDSWTTLQVAPSLASRLYLAGYRFVKQCDANSTNAGATCTVPADCQGANATCETVKRYLLFTSANGGTSYTPMSQTGLSTTIDSLMYIVGVSPTTPTTVYLRVSLEKAGTGDAIYKSTNGGTSWTKIFEADESPVSFVARANGDLIAASQTLGAFVSTDGGTMWTPLASAPHINCLAENAAGEVWACTQDMGTTTVPGDGFGIMKSTDLSQWTGVLKYEAIQKPVECPIGTAQRDQCVESYMSHASVWCCLETQLGITSTAIDCSMPPRSCALPVLDGLPDDAGTTIVHPHTKGCCETGEGGAPGAVVLALVSGGILLRRRRTR